MLLEDALAFYRQFLAEAPDDPQMKMEIARATARLGIIRSWFGDHVAGESALRQAIEALNRFAADNPDEPSGRAWLAHTKHCLGVVLHDTGRRREAETELGETLQLWQGLIADFPDDAEYRFSGCMAARALCRTLLTERRPQEALTLLQTAASYLDGIKPTPNAPRLPISYYRARLLSSIGLAERNLNHAAAAEDAFRKSDGLARELNAANRSDPALRQMVAYNGLMLATIMGPPRAKEAEPLLREAVGLLEPLTVRYSKVSIYRETLAEVYLVLARLQQDARRVDEAIKIYERSIVLLEELAEEFPRRDLYPHNLGMAANNLAALRSNIPDYRDLPAAKALFEKAVRFQRMALELSPNGPDFLTFLRNHLVGLMWVNKNLSDHRAAVARAEEVVALRNHGYDTYLAAVAYGSCIPIAEQDAQLAPEGRRDLAAKYADRTIAVLQLASDRGYRDAGRLRDNAAFAPLRERSDFQQIMSEMANRTK